MREDYTEGIAFILEGATEKNFYLSLLKYFSTINQDIDFTKINSKDGDIEDILLYDLAGICEFLNISIPGKLTGRKGKAKMKALFRSCGATYHEGEKAEHLIEALDKEKLIDHAPLDLSKLKKSLLGKDQTDRA